MTDIKLNFIHVCDQVLVSSDGKVSIIGIFSEIKAIKFPALHPNFSVISNIEGKEGEYDQTIELLDSSGKKMAAVSGKSEIKKDGSKNNFVANFVNIVFPEEGKYKIISRINDEILNKDDETIILVKR